MLPLLLALGMLAGGSSGLQFLKDRRASDLADQYRGLLGSAPGPMGPPDESGQMGYTQGKGLLADPKDIGRQLEFASGVAGLRGQQGVGLQLLNAAMQRAQQEAERAQQGQQYDQSAQRQQQQFDLTFGAGRADAAAAQGRWDQEFGLRKNEIADQRIRWGKEFGLHENADRRAETLLGMQQQEAVDKQHAGPELARLPAGWQYVPGAAGQAVAAPVPGTTDWSKGVEGAQRLQGVDDRIGQMLDMLEGKERTTKGGVKVRQGGTGSEMFGQRAAQYSVLRGQLISDLGKLREQGVLDQKEYDRLSDQVGDPTTLGSYFTRNSTMGAGYEEMRKLFRGKLQDHIAANPWLIPSVPAGFEPVKH
jgi:hypothetical protein